MAAGSENDGVCPTTQFEFNWWRIATILVSAAFAICYTWNGDLYQLRRMVLRLDAALHRQGEAALQGRLQPLEHANLASTILQTGSNATEMQVQLGENTRIINTLYIPCCEETCKSSP